MDLYAYSQIGYLDSIAKANNISVPRLRGYRLMSKEELLSNNAIAENINDQIMYLYERTTRTIPRFHPESNRTEISWATARLKEKYCILSKKKCERSDGSVYYRDEVVGFRWELIHGKNRKRLKFAIKKARKAVLRNLLTFNKYVGRSDILYIHARIGGLNWAYFGGADIEREPWFVEKVDDYFDDTYCDIYAKIDVIPEVDLTKTEE